MSENTSAPARGSSRGVAARREPDALDRRIINALQGEFPLTSTPFADAAVALEISADELIARIEAMLADRVLTRFGPMYQIERMGGAFCLAAIAVPEARWDEVVEAVNAFPEVAHNYRREHELNMWFVLATEQQEGIADTGARIAAACGLEVHLFPKEREYFVEMRLQA